MNMQIHSPGPTLTEAALTDCESKLGVTLPPDYRSFLLRYNGGRPSPDVVDVPDDPQAPTDIQVFFGVGRQKGSDLVENYEWLQELGEGIEMLPIATDSFGNFFCLRLSGAGEASVVYRSVVESVATTYKVAKTFADFLNAIREHEG